MQRIDIPVWHGIPATYNQPLASMESDVHVAYSSRLGAKGALGRLLKLPAT